jgi:hypothetical protein
MPTRLVSVVFDSTDPAALARWWAEALGWHVTYEAADEVDVEPTTARVDQAGGDRALPTLVFLPVPEPKVAKNRLHLDLASDSVEHQRAIVERLRASGARLVDIGQVDVPWVVLGDLEGNELCVLEPRDRYVGAGPVAAVSLDCLDPWALAPFWAAATGRDVVPVDARVASLRQPDRRPPDLDLVRVPEPKTVKNRVHLDVAPYPGDDQAAEVTRLIRLGARAADVGQRADATWVVLADPEGGELCVLSPG